MPNHQNPSGRHAGRRGAAVPLLQAAVAAGPGPGGRGLPRPPVRSGRARASRRRPFPLAPVISVGTFSKVIAPGLRVAWLAGPEAVIARLALLKQVTDLHTNSLTQRARPSVRLRRAPSGTGGAVARGLPEEAGRASWRRWTGTWRAATWTRTAGGMFLLLRLPAGRSARALLPAALDHGVAFVPGAPFFPRWRRRGTMRLNFVSPPWNRSRTAWRGRAEAICC